MGQRFKLMYDQLFNKTNRKGTAKSWNRWKEAKGLALDRTKWKSFTKALCSTWEPKKRRISYLTKLQKY
jgi:hypothetical protein